MHNRKFSLHEEAFYGHTEIVSELLDNKAHINSKNIDGDTPLMYAVRNGNSKTVYLLLKKKANISLVNNQGNNALIEAAIQYHLRKDVITALLEHKANINEANTLNGNTALICAARKNGDRREAISFLLEKKADINFLNFAGNNAFIEVAIACAPNFIGSKKIDGMLALLEQGPEHDPNKEQIKSILNWANSNPRQKNFMEWFQAYQEELRYEEIGNDRVHQEITAELKSVIYVNNAISDFFGKKAILHNHQMPKDIVELIGSYLKTKNLFEYLTETPTMGHLPAKKFWK